MFAIRRIATVSKPTVWKNSVKVSPAFVQRAYLSNGPINNGPTPVKQKNSETIDTEEIGNMISHIKKSTSPKLSPTLQKFCLSNKVAVVTG